MKPKPIIFSTEMVRAILDGRKTQTRRVIKVTNPNEWEGINNCRDSECGASVPCYLYRPEATEGRGIHYPRYDVGDNLWVRETFCEIPYEYERIPIGGGHITLPKYAYRADSKIDYTGIWRPSIHMPREAARLFLLVKAVRVERLQDITHVDAQCEGVEMASDDELQEYGYRAGFKQLWDSLNAKRGYSWESNPWVWVIEFERTEVPR